MSASKWAGFECYGLDFETTAPDPLEARAVTAAWVHIPREGRPKTRTWLVDPGVEIPAEATEIHRITTAHARERGGDPAQMLFEISGLVALALGHGYPVVAFNASYDFTLLEAENHRHGIEGLAARLGSLSKVQPVIDPFVLDRYADRYRKGGRKLADLCSLYGVVHTGEHDAEADALAACRLWPRIMAKHSRKFPGSTLPSLHQSQVQWRREQSDSLRDFWLKQGDERWREVDSGWPFHSRLPGLLAAAGVSS